VETAHLPMSRARPQEATVGHSRRDGQAGHPANEGRPLGLNQVAAWCIAVSNMYPTASTATQTEHAVFKNVKCDQ